MSYTFDCKLMKNACFPSCVLLLVKGTYNTSMITAKKETFDPIIKCRRNVTPNFKMNSTPPPPMLKRASVLHGNCSSLRQSQLILRTLLNSTSPTRVLFAPPMPKSSSRTGSGSPEEKQPLRRRRGAGGLEGRGGRTVHLVSVFLVYLRCNCSFSPIAARSV